MTILKAAPAPCPRTFHHPPPGHRSPRSSRHQVQETRKLINPPNQFSFHQQAGLSQGSAFFVVILLSVIHMIKGSCLVADGWSWFFSLGLIVEM